MLLLFVMPPLVNSSQNDEKNMLADSRIKKSYQKNVLGKIKDDLPDHLKKCDIIYCLDNYYQDEASKRTIQKLCDEGKKIFSWKRLNETYPGCKDFNDVLKFCDKETLSEIEHLMLPYAKLYYQKNPMMQVGHISENDALSRLYLNNAWVNFQNKHEFNPSHTHTGIISFVVWLKVPYTIKEEMMNKSVAYSNSPVAGCFQFMYCDALGNINGHTISCEKETEGTILIFPAKMQHCVYPFFTSDEYRISISGNFYIKDH